MSFSAYGSLVQTGECTSFRYIFADAAVEFFVFEEEDRIGVVKGGVEHVLSILYGSRYQHPNAWQRHEPAFDGLRVKGAGTDSCTVRGAYRNVQIRRPAVSTFGQVVHNLIVSAGDKVCKLHLNNGFESFHGQSDGGTDRSRFDNGCVADSIFAISWQKSFRYFEHASIFGDVLPHKDEVSGFVECLPVSSLNGIDKASVCGWGVR